MKKSSLFYSALLLGLVAVFGYAQAPVPFIRLPLVPDAVAPGGADFILTVNGTGFVSGSAVNWNGSPLATTLVSGSQLTATVPAADIAKASTASVTVVNPAPGGGTSNVVFFTVTNPASSLEFQTSVITTGESYLETATAGDFNGDGKVDLVVANRASFTVSILLGKGDGTFQPPVNYGVGLSDRWVITGDFNGDGKLDLACGGDDSAQVSILLGNGDGTFQPATQYATGAGNTWGAAADFNGDGKLDLAVAGYGKVSILLGKGDGTLPAHVDYELGVGYTWVGAGDFNLDGKLDLAVAGTGVHVVSILLGNGDGTFQPHVDYPTGINPRSLVVGDFNADGNLDLAVADQSSWQVSVLLGNGDGTFLPRVDYGPVAEPTWISAGDFNGDGKLDLVVSPFRFVGEPKASVLLGNGDGTFQPPLTYPAGGYGSESGTVADFNGDGMLDVAFVNSWTNTVSVLLQARVEVKLSRTSESFLLRTVGSTSPKQRVTLTNIGSDPLDITGIRLMGTNRGDFAKGSNCGSSLPAGKSCLIGVTFKPAAEGDRTASLSIADNAPGSPQTVALTGKGTFFGRIPWSMNFGDQPVGTTSTAQTTIVTNAGPTAMAIYWIRIEGANPGDFAQANNCPASLNPGATCTVSVTFTPTATGLRSGLVVVHDSAFDGPHKVSLSGTGT